MKKKVWRISGENWFKKKRQQISNVLPYIQQQHQICISFQIKHYGQISTKKGIITDNEVRIVIIISIYKKNDNADFTIFLLLL